MNDLSASYDQIDLIMETQGFVYQSEAIAYINKCTTDALRTLKRGYEPAANKSRFVAFLEQTLTNF